MGSAQLGFVDTVSRHEALRSGACQVDPTKTTPSPGSRLMSDGHGLKRRPWSYHNFTISYNVSTQNSCGERNFKSNSNGFWFSELMTHSLNGFFSVPIQKWLLPTITIVCTMKNPPTITIRKSSSGNRANGMLENVPLSFMIFPHKNFRAFSAMSTQIDIQEGFPTTSSSSTNFMCEVKKVGR